MSIFLVCPMHWILDYKHIMMLMWNNWEIASEFEENLKEMYFLYWRNAILCLSSKYPSFVYNNIYRINFLMLFFHFSRHRPSPTRFPIIVSQDCGDAATASSIKAYGSQVTLIQVKSINNKSICPQLIPQLISMKQHSSLIVYWVLHGQ